MATPVWTTTAGKIATIDEQVAFSLQLEANTSDSTAITYSLIAGSLPAGMQVTTDGLLTGTPAEVAKRTLYTFVVRATAGTAITDRTFSLDVQGADAPTFTTASGQLQLDDSTRVGLYWVIDGSSISLQMQATDSDTEAGQSLSYEIVQGELPPGITLSKTGLISGIVQLTEDQRFAPRHGYDGGGTDDEFDGIYDQTVTTKSVSKNFDFIIRVSDGTSFVDQNNSIFVYSADFWRVSNSVITIDATEIDSTPLTMDLSANRRPVFRTGSDLGTFRHSNNVVIKIDVEGNEMNVLKGATSFIESSSPFIIIEISKYIFEDKNNLEYLKNFLQKFNYSIYNTNKKKVSVEDIMTKLSKLKDKYKTIGNYYLIKNFSKILEDFISDE